MAYYSGVETNQRKKNDISDNGLDKVALLER